MAKILIVEDDCDPAAMTDYLHLLDHHDFQVAYSHREAFAKYIAYEPDIIIIDVMQQTGDGKDLCGAIRKIDQTLPIILTSSNQSLLNDYRHYGANDTIYKPFTTEVVLEKIANQFNSGE